ncbi:MAG: DUF2784 domain-containing protein [Thermoguttaceae bacterium]|jgi:hypothetical protein
MLAYRLLADLIVVVHVAYVGFVVVGMLLILMGIWRRWAWIRNFWFRAGHFAAIALVVVESVWGVVCPLTDWEYRLRVLGGEGGEPGSFVGRCLHAVLFVELKPWQFTVAYCLFGLAVLATLAWSPPRRPRFMARGRREG